MIYEHQYNENKSNYLNIKSREQSGGNDSTTYEDVMENIKNVKYFWKYYKHYPDFTKEVNESQLYEKYQPIYKGTKQRLSKEPFNVFEKFVDAWIKDASETNETIGPYFSITVCEYFKDCDDPKELYDEWFRNAAVYDMVYDLLLHYKNDKFNKLKKILDKNKWLQETIINKEKRSYIIV